MAASNGDPNSRLEQNNSIQEKSKTGNRHQESTDLDDSRAVISMMQAKGGASPDKDR